MCNFFWFLNCLVYWSLADAENGEGEEGEWEWEEEEEEAEDKPEDATGKAAITIDGNLLKINRGPVDWSDDEFEDDDDEPKAVAPPAAPLPPPPPPLPPAPPSPTLHSAGGTHKLWFFIHMAIMKDSNSALEVATRPRYKKKHQ